MFQVTEDCIRKDLKTLENAGKLKRTYGGPMDHGFAIKNEFTLSHDEITAEAADKEAK